MIFARFNALKYSSLLIFSLTSSLLLFNFLPGGSASAGVTAFDSVTVPGRTLLLKAMTRGRFFPAGGRLVDFRVDGNDIGRSMSGGDGYAFLEYKPESPGMKRVEVISGEERASGLILVAEKGDKLVLIEVEHTILSGSILHGEKDNAGREVVRRIGGTYKIIYLTTLLGPGQSRKLLDKGGLYPSVVMKWRGTEMLEDWKTPGLQIFAVIGSPAILSETAEYSDKRFSFQDSENGVHVKDWDEVLKMLAL